MLRQNRSVATLAIVMLVAVATVLLGTLGAINYIMESRDARSRLEAQTMTMANQLAAGLTLPLWNFDRPQIDKIVDSAMEAPEVYAVVVQQFDVAAPGGATIHMRMRDAKGGLTSSTGSLSPVGLLVQERIVGAPGEPLGSVQVFITTKLIEQRLRKSLLMLAGRIIVFDLILICSLYILLRRIVLLPLRSVEQYALIVSSGGSHTPVTGPRRFSGEIESLRSSIEKMIVLLDERYTALQTSEAKLTGVLNSVPHYIFWKDLNGVYLGGNRMFARAMGLNDAYEVAGKTDFDFWPASDAERYRQDDKNVIEAANPRQHIFMTIRPSDKTELWVEATKLPMLDENGKVFGVLGVYENITERRRAEEALRLNEEQFRLLFDQSIVGIVICEVICDESGTPRDFRLIRANPAYNKLTGMNREDQVGMTGEQLNWKWPNDIQERLMSLACTGGDFAYERYNEGLGRYYEVRAFSPKPGQFALIFNDVSERKRTEAVLLESEKMRTIAGLAAGMAHEINNPLAGMLQNAQVILNRVSPDLPANHKAAEHAGTTVSAVQSYLDERGIPGMLQAIRSSGERAAEIVANMLSFSRRNEAQMSLHVLADLADQTVDLACSDYDLKKNFDFKSIEIVRDYAAVMPGVPCRATEIQQVVLNLLKNAAQAMAERGDRDDAPRIVVRTRRNGDMARIEVEDNGPGVSESVRRRMFEPFFTTKDPQSGTGLGLFVSYFIITRNHGGNIAVESHPGVGTRFMIDLPLQQEGTS